MIHAPGALSRGVDYLSFASMVFPIISFMSVFYAWTGPLSDVVQSYQLKTANLSVFSTLIERPIADAVLLAAFAFLYINVVYLRKYGVFWVAYAAIAFKNIGKEKSAPMEWDGPDFKPLALAFSAAMVVGGIGVIAIQFWISWESGGSMQEVETAAAIGEGVGHWFSQMMDIPALSALYDFRLFVPGAADNAWRVFILLFAAVAGFVFFTITAFIDGTPRGKIARYATYGVLGLAGLYLAPLVLWFLIGAIIAVMYMVAGFLLIPVLAIGFIWFPMLLILFVTSVLVEWRSIALMAIVVCNLIIADGYWVRFFGA